VIVDSSAIVAILSAERDARELANAIEEAAESRVSVVNYVETAIVLDSRRDPALSRRFDALMREAQVLLESVTVEPG
jgi:ribonuclease VapC